MSVLHFALRDEIVNFHAMTTGDLPNEYSHQIFICKKKLLKNKAGVPFLLDVKKSKSSRYDLSDIGRWYFDKVRNVDFPLKYAAFIDCQIEIKINLQTFIDLSEQKFFSVWSPVAPMDYFEGADTGYLTVFRVYTLEKEIDEDLLLKGRAGKNFLYGLTEDQDLDLAEPVIPNEKFDRIKHDLLSLLKANKAFVGIYG